MEKRRQGKQELEGLCQFLIPGKKGRNYSTRCVWRPYGSTSQLSQVDVGASTKQPVQYFGTDDLREDGQQRCEQHGGHPATKSESPNAPDSERPVIFRSQNTGTLTSG